MRGDGEKFIPGPFQDSGFGGVLQKNDGTDIFLAGSGGNNGGEEKAEGAIVVAHIFDFDRGFLGLAFEVKLVEGAGGAQKFFYLF